MNKKEWKIQYGALRALYMAAIRMAKLKETPERDAAINMAWRMIEDSGMRAVFVGKHSNQIYRLLTNKWAVRHNCSNY